MKIAIIDLETSGLNPQRHEIIEIGGVVFDAHTFEKFSTIDMKVKPKTPWLGDPNAYLVNGYNPDEWKDAIPLIEAMKKLRERTAGAVFCAYNMMFDWEFLKEAERTTGIKLEFSTPRVDLLSMAWACIPQKKMLSWSMKSVCTFLNIEREANIHRALNGAEKEFEIYRSLLS